MPPLLGSVNNLAQLPYAAQVKRALRGSLRFTGLLLVIGTYVHYRYARVGSSEFSTAGDWTGPT
jgi:hypothetical protein